MSGWCNEQFEEPVILSLFLTQTRVDFEQKLLIPTLMLGDVSRREERRAKKGDECGPHCPICPGRGVRMIFPAIVIARHLFHFSALTTKQP